MAEIFEELRKKNYKPQDDAVVIETEMVQESELKQKKEEEKHSLGEELRRTRSNSSSSSDEEGGERKKKKGLKEKIKDKLSHENEEDVEHKNACLPDENCTDTGNIKVSCPEEKKGFLEKIKEKLPGQQKKTEDGTLKPPAESEADGHSPGDETKEKKGFMEKIMDKLPGSHKNGEDKKEN